MNDGVVHADDIFKINALFRQFEREHQEEEIARQLEMLEKFNNGDDFYQFYIKTIWKLR